MVDQHLFLFVVVDGGFFCSSVRSGVVTAISKRHFLAVVQIGNPHSFARDEAPTLQTRAGVAVSNTFFFRPLG